MLNLILLGAGFILSAFLFAGVRIIRPHQRGLKERLGKYQKFAEPGFHWIIPLIDKMVIVDITEAMMEMDTQEIITEDNLNANVDLVVYYKIKEDEKSVKKSIYKVEDFEPQITRFAQTTARNVIGTMVFKDVNSKRHQLNNELAKIIREKAVTWGIEVLNVELKDINPPKEVQDTMNSVIQAENTKRAAVDFATAKETEADGLKRSEIKKAEGVAKAKETIAEGQAKAIKLVNEAASKYFTGNAQLLKQLEVTESALKDNTKVVLTERGITPNIILGEIPFKSR